MSDRNFQLVFFLGIFKVYIIWGGSCFFDQHEELGRKVPFCPKNEHFGEFMFLYIFSEYLRSGCRKNRHDLPPDLTWCCATSCWTTANDSFYGSEPCGSWRSRLETTWETGRGVQFPRRFRECFELDH